MSLIIFHLLNLKEGDCRFERANVGATAKSYSNIRSGDEEALAAAIASKGPVSVAIDASPTSFQFYSKGITSSSFNNPRNLWESQGIINQLKKKILGTEISENSAIKINIETMMVKKNLEWYMFTKKSYFRSQKAKNPSRPQIMIYWTIWNFQLFQSLMNSLVNSMDFIEHLLFFFLSLTFFLIISNNIVFIIAFI